MSNAAIYARVSSARQKEQDTIGSQTAALRAHAEQAGLDVPGQWMFTTPTSPGRATQNCPRRRPPRVDWQEMTHVHFCVLARFRVARPLCVYSGRRRGKVLRGRREL